MAFLFHYNNNPLENGYIIEFHKTCGKKNCHCFTKGEKHKSYALKYWVYDYATKTRKQKIQYLKKSELTKTQKQLAIIKGKQLLFNNDSRIFEVYNKYPHLNRKELYIQAYLDYGNSQKAKTWLNS